MNEEALNTMYALAQKEGYKDSIDDFVALMETNEEALNTMYSLAQSQGYNDPIDDFSELMGIKKKNLSGSPSQNPFMVFMPSSEDGTSELDFTQITNPDPLAEKNFIGGKLGDLVNELPFGLNDLVDDSMRSLYVGQKEGAKIDETLALMYGGTNVDRETVQSYVEAVAEYENMLATVGESQEMKSFQKTYQEEGESVFGFLKGLYQNPSVIPQVFLQSMAGMANSTTLTEGLAILGGGAVSGSGGGPGGAVAGVVAAAPYALMAMGGTLETSASFSEFLREELGERDFTVDNVLSVMQDEKAYARMRNKALTRGVSIGVFDAIGGRLVTSVGGKILRKTGSKLKAVGVGAGIEVVSGSSGEAMARFMVGQPMDVADIGLEGIAGTSTLPITVGATLLTQPRYRIQGQKTTREDILSVINNATPEQIQAGLLNNLEVKNDKQLSDAIDQMKKVAEVDAQIDPRVQGEDRQRLVALEVEREKYLNSTQKSSKNRLKEIDEEIDSITNKVVEESKVQPLESKQPEPIETQDESASANKKLNLSDYDLVREKNSGELYRKIKRGAGPEGTSVYVKEGTDVYMDDAGILRPSANEANDMVGETAGNSLFEPVEVKRPKAKRQKIADGTYVIRHADGDFLIRKTDSGKYAAYDTTDPSETSDENAWGESFRTIKEAIEYADRLGVNKPDEQQAQTEADGTPQEETNIYTLDTSQQPDEQQPQQPQEPEQPEPPTHPRWVWNPDDMLQPPKPEKEMSVLQRLFKRGRRDITLNGQVYDKYSRNRWLKRQWNQTFKSNAGLDNDVAEIYRQLQRDIAAYNDKIGVEVNALSEIKKKAGKKTDEATSNARYDLINEYMMGNTNVNLDFLTEEDIDALDYSRERIDSLSQRIIDVLNQKMQDGKMTQAQKEATQQLIDTIQLNEGKYVKRTYQAFADPSYLDGLTIPYDEMTDSAQERFDGAVEYLVQNEGMSTEEAISTVTKYLDGLKMRDGSESAVGKAGAAAARFLDARKDIPKEFRELLGEVKDPLYNYANTTEQLSGFLSSIEYQQTLRDVVMGGGIGTDSPKPGYTKLSPSSKSWSYLHDIYVPNEFKEAMDSLGPLQNLNDGVYKWMVQAASIGKLNKTVLSPTTTFRNFYSGALLALNSGHFFNMSPDKIVSSAAMAWGPRRNNQELQAEREKLISLGIIGDTARAGELTATLNDFGSFFGDPNTKGPRKKAIEFAKQAYAFGDDFYKTIGFYQERQRLMESGLSEGAATFKAAERIRGGYPTYSYIPPNIRKLRRNPFIGSFVSFPYEVVRTTKNNFLYAIEDLQSGRTKVGMQRLAGMVTATTGLAALSTASKNLFDLSDEDDERIRSLVPPYQQDAELLYMGKDENSAIFVDGTALFPSEVIVRPIRMILENPQDETLAKRVEDSLEEALKPYIGLDLTTKTGYELFKNENEYGGKIYDEGEQISSIPLLNGAVNDPKGILNYLAKKAGPGVYNNVQELGRALELAPDVFGDKVSSYREYTPEDALLGFLGFRQTTTNYYQAVSNKVYSDNEARIERQSEQLRAISTSKFMSPEEVENLYNAYSAANEKFNNTVLGFIDTGRTLGMAEEKISSALSKAGMSRRDVAQVMGGGKIPLKIVSKQRYTDKIFDLESRSSMIGADKSQEMVQMYQQNVEAFNKLVQQNVGQ